MNISGFAHDKMKNVNGFGLYIRHQHFISAAGENGNRGCGISDSGSTSDCNFSESTKSPMLTNETSADWNSRQRGSPYSVPSMKTYWHSVPQGTVPSHEFTTGWPLIYTQQQQPNFNFNAAQMAAPSLHPFKVQTQQIIQSSWPVQPRFLVYPVQHCQCRAQNCNHTPALTTAVPCMVRPVPYLYASRPSASGTATGAFSSVTVPSPSYYNTNGCCSTPEHSTTSCSTMTSSCSNADVVPILKLRGDNSPRCPMPTYLSCSIHGGLASGRHSSVPENQMAVPETSRILMKPNKTINRTSPLQERGELIKGNVLKKEEHLWKGNLDYAEIQRDGCSNLFITWYGSVTEIGDIYRNFNVIIVEVLKTTDKSIHNVIFDSHTTARKAFIMQKRIRLRAVPPKNSSRNWLRSPSPEFLVNFETKRRLVVRKGRAQCHEIVGDLLKGCLICADQLKGNRMRLVGCEGNFLFTGGQIVEMKGIPSKSGMGACLGWISCGDKYSKETFLIRRSWNKLQEYIFNE